MNSVFCHGLIVVCECQFADCFTGTIRGMVPQVRTPPDETKPVFPSFTGGRVPVARKLGPACVGDMQPGTCGRRTSERSCHGNAVLPILPPSPMPLGFPPRALPGTRLHRSAVVVASGGHGTSAPQGGGLWIGRPG